MARTTPAAGTYSTSPSDRSLQHRELGKLSRTAPDGLILQLGGHGHRPWLSLDDRCRPMLKARRRTAGENELGAGVVAMVTSSTGGRGPSSVTTCLVAKGRRPAAGSGGI
jgi:hypothetical protein